GRARRRPGQRPESRERRRALPSRDRLARQPDRLRRRAAAQEVAARARGSEAMSDLETLTALNRDYIDAVQNSDTKRFEEILSDDFLNTNPDGALVDRKGFLAQIAPKARIT